MNLLGQGVPHLDHNSKKSSFLCFHQLTSDDDGTGSWASSDKSPKDLCSWGWTS